MDWLIKNSLSDRTMAGNVVKGIINELKGE